MKNNFRQITKYPLLIIFTVLTTVFFLCFLIVPEKEKSEWENRYLAKRPEFSVENVLDGSFMRDFESYTNDQIVFRDALIKMKAVSEAICLKNVNNGIARGKNGYLFTEDVSDGKVFDKNTGIIKTFIEKILDEDDSDQIRSITVAIAPNSVAILDDYIPEGMPVINQAEKIDSYNREISLLDNVRVVNLLETLKSHGEEYIYYRTDHHWTTLGAYLAYSLISDNPIGLDSLDSHQVNNFYGTLYAKYKGLRVDEDSVIFYDIPVDSFDYTEDKTDTLYDMSKVDVFDKYGLFLYGNHGIASIKSKDSADKKDKLIVFKDSYANCLIPFLTYDYGEIIIVDLRYYGQSVNALLEDNKDADILFLYNFDFLNEDNHFYKLMK